MKSKTAKVAKLETAEKLGVLAGMLLFVIQGLRNGSISSKPILNITPRAKNYGMTTLEDEIWKALNKCGIREKSAGTAAEQRGGATL